MIGLPNINITFKQLSNTFLERSERGVAVLIIKDDTSNTFKIKEYKELEELNKDKDLYTPENLIQIKDVLSFAINRVVVVKISKDETIKDALSLIEKNIQTGWITTICDDPDYDILINWIKDKESKGKTYKAVTYKATSPDSKHIVNFVNETVTFKDERNEISGKQYLPSLVGILASCNVKRGSTYFVCKNLAKVQETDDNNTEVSKGNLVLINDYNKVKIGLGINSLLTLQENDTIDMKFIDIVEAMDLINEDIRKVFIEQYIGVKNSYVNQTIFIEAVNTYFKSLENEEILDNLFENKVSIDVQAQREAWIKSGKTEAATWTDSIVKNNTYRRDVFLYGDIKVLGAIENLKFTINIA